MKKKIVYFLLSAFIAVGCTDNNLYDVNAVDYSIKQNVLNIFGTTFSENQDWKSAINGTVTIVANPEGFDDVVKVQILTKSPFGNGDANGSTILNEANVSFGETVTLTYDTPDDITRLYAACVSSNGDYYIRSFNYGDNEVVFNKAAKTRAINEETKAQVDLLPANPTLGGFITSYADNRGYEGFNDKLFYVNNSLDLMMSLSDFSEEVKQDLRDIVFTYLPNKVSNIEKIREHYYYNANCYPITTGDEPIVVEPIYKNDGGWHEVEHCALYYYYFTDAQLEGKSDDEQVAFFKQLPKFRALDLNDVVLGNGVSTGLTDDEIKRNTAFAIIFWGANMNEIGAGTVGSYQFPRGYKIGFMLRNEGKNVHQGELYCDGRLNKEVNKWGHLASSQLGDTDARMAWLSGNKKNLLCCEEGTDRDFNDIVFEIEGGIEPIGIIPDIDYNSYMFCFEDELIGDYDMNDVVIKTKRLNETQVEYSIVACGAYDELYICGIDGDVINQNTEVHNYFTDHICFINTVPGQTFDIVSEVINVDKEFSFLNENTQPYLYNKTTNKYVKIARKGEDPHGIMIPEEFRYPIEKTCIKDAFSDFNNWGEGLIESTGWYRTPIDGMVY